MRRVFPDAPCMGITDWENDWDHRLGKIQD